MVEKDKDFPSRGNNSRLRRVDDSRWKVVSAEFATIMMALTINIGATVWWASGMEHRVSTIEKTRNTQSQGDVRDIRIDRLEEIAIEQSRIHQVQNVKMENMQQDISAIKSSVAVIEERSRSHNNDGNHQ